MAYYIEDMLHAVPAKLHIFYCLTGGYNRQLTYDVPDI